MIYIYQYLIPQMVKTLHLSQYVKAHSESLCDTISFFDIWAMYKIERQYNWRVKEFVNNHNLSRRKYKICVYQYDWLFLQEIDLLRVIDQTPNAVMVS